VKDKVTHVIKIHPKISLIHAGKCVYIHALWLTGSPGCNKAQQKSLQCASVKQLSRRLPKQVLQCTGTYTPTIWVRPRLKHRHIRWIISNICDWLHSSQVLYNSFNKQWLDLIPTEQDLQLQTQRSVRQQSHVQL